MVRLSIDGREIEVPEGTNLVEAARRLGIEIPTYCYHPGLSVVGQCRICFVEVTGFPRLVTACSTVAEDGMEVATASEEVIAARQAVMEFLLANHPLDCPVCDQAGECLLQEYSVEHGADGTRMVDTRRRYPDLERRDLGPMVVQNQNRCIHCTRCIRFTEEISETRDLTMKSRGNSSFIDTATGEPFDNPWSACVADVCPVGALTVRDFRFRARVWHLEETPTICPGCSIGCSIHVGHHRGEVHRFTPRQNPEINGWWMCDHGRSLARSALARDIDQAGIATDDHRGATTWSLALAQLAQDLVTHRPLVVASAALSNEALYLIRRVLGDVTGLEVVVPYLIGKGRRIKNGRGEWVASHDAHPNLLGARLIGHRIVAEEDLAGIFHGRSVVLLDTLATPWLATAEAAEAPDLVLAVAGRRLTPLAERAELRLPSASWVETEGTFTSSTGRVQLAVRALLPRAGARPMWSIVTELAQHLGVDLPEFEASRDVFTALVHEVPAFAGMTHGRLRNGTGLPLLEEVPRVG